MRRVLNYVEHLLILTSTVTDCVSIAAFASGVPAGIASFSVGLKICAITAGIKKKEEQKEEKA